MFYTYILKSQKTKRYYIGQTENLNNRLKRHNTGLVKSTKHGVPWEMTLYETFNTKSEACCRESEIKGYKGGIKFKRLLGLWKE